MGRKAAHCGVSWGSRAAIATWIVDCHPDGYHLCPVHGPVGKILVPGYYFGVVRQFAKVMGPDGGKIRTEEVFGQIEDLRTCDQVINPAIHHVGTTD